MNDVAMRIEVLYFEGCPNYRVAIDRLRIAMDTLGIAEDVIEVNITSPTMAQDTRFIGSPSIRVNGLDVEPEARSSRHFGLSCRTYPQGAPSVETICAAILEARAK
jgi:hypothetical protein